MRPPVTYYGGKAQMAHVIVDAFPEHETYLEPFGGSAAVLLNKAPASVDSYNDVDFRIVNLFRVLRDMGGDFIRALQIIPFSESEFKAAIRRQYELRRLIVLGEVESLDDAPPDLDRAVWDFVTWRQSFAGRKENWRFCTTKKGSTISAVVRSWLSIVDVLPAIIERLKTVQLFCRPAIRVIERLDNESCLIYCDPPYVHASRREGSSDVYFEEMSDDDHRELAETLNRCESKVIVSGYPSRLYDEIYKGWDLLEFDRPERAGLFSPVMERPRRIECLWLNF